MTAPLPAVPFDGASGTDLDTASLPVVADTETMPALQPVTEPQAEILAPLPEPAYLSDFGQEAEAQFLQWVDAFQARTRTDWDGRIGPVDSHRAGIERKRINDELDAGMLACRRIAAQAVVDALPPARTPASHHRSEAEIVPSAAWTAPLPAIEGLPRHGHRRHGGAA